MSLTLESLAASSGASSFDSLSNWGFAVDAAAFDGLDVARQGGPRRTPAGTGTGGRDRYGDDHPFLTADAADWLVGMERALVGIDSNNIDDTRVRTRPVHTSAARRRTSRSASI